MHLNTLIYRYLNSVTDTPKTGISITLYRRDNYLIIKRLKI